MSKQWKLTKLKRKRLEEKKRLYGNPEDYALPALMKHFFAECGKLQHNWFHQKDGWMEAFADVSNLHDMILNQLKKGVQGTKRLNEEAK